MTKCSVASATGSRNREAALGENQGNLKKVWTSVNNNVSILVH